MSCRQHRRPQPHTYTSTLSACVIADWLSHGRYLKLCPLSLRTLGAGNASSVACVRQQRPSPHSMTARKAGQSSRYRDRISPEGGEGFGARVLYRSHHHCALSSCDLVLFSSRLKYACTATCLFSGRSRSLKNRRLYSGGSGTCAAASKQEVGGA